MGLYATLDLDKNIILSSLPLLIIFFVRPLDPLLPHASEMDARLGIRITRILPSKSLRKLTELTRSTSKEVIHSRKE